LLPDIESHPHSFTCKKIFPDGSSSKESKKEAEEKKFKLRLVRLNEVKLKY